jgi:hypothetical protein
MPTPQAPVSPFRTRSRTPFRLVPVPNCEPPYDRDQGPYGLDWLDATGGGACSPGHQGALALAFVLPSGVPAVPSPPEVTGADRTLVARPALRSVEPGVDPVFAPQRTARTVLPNPRSWAALLGQAVVEVLAGHRPATQLVRWTTGRVHASLATLSMDERGGRPARRQGRAVVRSVRVSEPEDGIAEAAVVVRESRRCWAMALRLEGVDGRWLCTALVLG